MIIIIDHGAFVYCIAYLDNQTNCNRVLVPAEEAYMEDTQML